MARERKPKSDRPDEIDLSRRAELDSQITAELKIETAELEPYQADSPLINASYSSSISSYVDSEEFNEYKADLERFKENQIVRAEADPIFANQLKHLIVICNSCGETLTGLPAIVARDFFSEDSCQTCYEENHYGKLPDISNFSDLARSPVNSKTTTEVSPWDEYAIKELEGR